MRKILVALLVFGLVVAFGAPASALDLKISGQYYVVGAFESNPSLATESYRNTLTNYRASSAAWVAQRGRLQPEFKIAEGLTFTTRFDFLEKKWGDVSWGQANNIYGYDNTNRSVDRPAGVNYSANDGSTIRTQENLEWERAYVDFNTAIGRFLVGYFDCICYGTLFLNTHVSRPGVQYQYPMGNWTFGAQWEHVAEGGSYGMGGAGAKLYYAESDFDIYSVSVDYRWKTGSAGIQAQYYHDSFNDYNKVTPAFVRAMYGLNPYVKATFGPLYVEAEGWYGFGDWADYRDATLDIDLEAWALYANAKYTMGPFYFGALFGYESGDDLSTPNEREGSVLGNVSAFAMGQAWDPFLYMFNDLMNTWHGNWGTRGTTIGTFEDNCLLWKAYAGWNATPKLRFEIGYGMAWADETAAGVDDHYGNELDIYGEYKIYDQLSYYVGFGYWWVGDYFKGQVGTASYGDVDDSWILFHGLRLNF